MSSNSDFASFTSCNSAAVVCQRCLRSFKKETELFFMHDNKPDGAGKRICAGCHQYYREKTESRNKSNLTLQPESDNHYSGCNSASVQSLQITPATQEVVSRQNVHRAVAEAQRKGIIRILYSGNFKTNNTYNRSKSPCMYPSRASTVHNAATTSSNFLHCIAQKRR